MSSSFTKAAARCSGVSPFVRESRMKSRPSRAAEWSEPSGLLRAGTYTGAVAITSPYAATNPAATINVTITVKGSRWASPHQLSARRSAVKDTAPDQFQNVAEGYARWAPLRFAFAAMH
jgi:hypothetical protein